ncbi:MAG: hypothetical protein E3J35_10295 [Methanomassiliicoccales archaeon]|nr:MAG: hypothetical protein E3J35_10295 [Methanomassiliicoccales archaeon]
MHRRDTCIVVIVTVLASAFAFAVTILPENAKAATLYVGGPGPGNYTTIQGAVDAAPIGSIVYVYSGTYNEHLTISKRLNLEGEDKNTTIIDGGGSSTVIRISDDWVSVTGFTIRNGGPGGGDAGIDISLADYCTIADNIIHNNSGGLELFRSHHNTITGNTMQDNEDGMFLVFSDNNTITFNTASGNSMFGINVGGSSDNTLVENYASDNYYGISTSGPRNVIVNNTAVNNTGNFYVGNDEYNLLQNNTAVNGEKGIELWYGSRNTIANNAVSGATKNGIYVHKANNNTIENNTVFQNYYGMNLAYSDDNVVMNNLATENSETGIGLYMSNRTILVRNDVRDNDHDGFKVWMSWYNNIYHNTIVGNHDIEGLDFMGLNYWDNGYPSGGNYWGDYTGDDERSGPNQDQPGYDEIGDLPYNVTGGTNQDRYPLMNSPLTSPPYPPYKPRDLTASGRNNQVLLTWSAPAYDGGSPITNYVIYRDTSIGGIEFLTEVGNVQEYTDNDVTNRQNYYYRISAKNAVGESQWTNWVNVAPNNLEPTCEITSLESGTIVSGTCTVEGASSDSDGTVERIEIRIDDGSWETATGTDSWSYNWDTTGVSNGEHTIQVRSYDGEDYSETSSISVTVDNPRPVQDWMWLIPVLIVLVILIAALAIVATRRRRKPPAVEKEPQPEVTYEETLPPPPPMEEVEEVPPPPPDEELPPPPPPPRMKR